MRHTVLIALALCLLAAPNASAQDAPRLGLVMGYPAAVGVLWNVSDRLALRPEISFTRTSIETTTTLTVVGLPVDIIPVSTTTTTEGWQVGIGGAALFYLSKKDALRTYISPRYVYTRSRTTTDSTPPTTTRAIQITETRANSHNATGSFGAQYALGSRFGVFGEVGLTYQHAGPPQASSTVTTTGSNWNLALRSGAGVILFF